MEQIKIIDHYFKVYIPNDAIIEAVKDVARRIDEQYKNSQKEPVLLITLSGAMPFAAELIKHLKTPHKWAFVKCSSYQDRMCTNGVEMPLEPTISVVGEEVIVLEDIIDTGETWEFLHKYCLEKGAQKVQIATLTFKVDAYKKNLPIDFIGLNVENKFIVGFGLDYAQQGRSLQHIYQTVD